MKGHLTGGNSLLGQIIKDEHAGFAVVSEALLEQPETVQAKLLPHKNNFLYLI